VEGVCGSTAALEVMGLVGYFLHPDRDLSLARCDQGRLQLLLHDVREFKLGQGQRHHQTHGALPPR
jgi:hypothetical protein